MSELLTLLPEAGTVLARYGLHCAGCVYSGVETIAQGCMGHGYSEEDVALLLEDLNALARERPERPLTLTVTQAAAEQLLAIATSEGRERDVLEVAVDERGGFCLEFREAAPDGALDFGHSSVRLRIVATPLTLGRIGGATIDFRDERFKLDLPEDAARCCGSGEACGCGAGAQ